MLPDSGHDLWWIAIVQQCRGFSAVFVSQAWSFELITKEPYKWMYPGSWGLGSCGRARCKWCYCLAAAVVAPLGWLIDSGRCGKHGGVPGDISWRCTESDPNLIWSVKKINYFIMEEYEMIGVLGWVCVYVPAHVRTFSLWATDPLHSQSLL